MKHPCIGEVISSSFSPCGRRVLKHDGLLVESADARGRSPRPACGRLRGEVGALPAMQSIVRRASGEGDSPRVELAERAPHPNPLPAKSGEREKRLAAAAPPTQPNLIMPYAFADAGTRPNNCACSRRAASTNRLVVSSITAAMRERNSVRDRPGGSGSRNSTTSVPG